MLAPSLSNYLGGGGWSPSSYAYVTWVPESYEVCQLVMTNETSSDSVVLTQETKSCKVYGLLLTNKEQRKNELTNN